MKKFLRILSVVIIACVSLVLVVALSMAAVSAYCHSDYYGMNRIRAVSKLNGTSKIYIYCSEYSGYTIQPIDTNALAYRGERQVPINSDLGDHVVKIRFGDEEPSEHFARKYSNWTTYQIGDSGISFMWAYSGGDHGHEIYIGSDTPIDVNDIRVFGIDYSDDVPERRLDASTT